MSANDGQNPGRIRIEHRRDGTLVETYELLQHSYLDNWYGAMQLLLHADNPVSLTDASGTAQSFETGSSAGPWEEPSLQMRVSIGTGTAGFTQSDNSLDNQLQATAVSSSATDTSNQLARGSSSFSINSSQTITETGLEWNNLQDASGNTHRVFFERTVLDTAVSVLSGDTLSVTYELTFNAP